MIEAGTDFQNVKQRDLQELGIISAADLQDRDIPRTSSVIPGYVTKGVNVLAGRPKIGKSYLALLLATAVAFGRTVLAGIETEAGPTLYLALEDNDRRVQDRLRRQLGSEPFPADLHIKCVWTKSDEGGIAGIRSWLNRFPSAKLVVIDNFARFRGKGSRSASLYQDDYDAIIPLKELADEFGIAILLVHHLRKMSSDDPLEMVSGTTGFTGAVDTIMVLHRARTEADAELYVTGRDVEESEIALKFENGIWTALGDAATYRQSKERRQVLKALMDADQPMSPKAIADALDQTYENVKKRVSKMASEGQINRIARGKYTI